MRTLPGPGTRVKVCRARGWLSAPYAKPCVRVCGVHACVPCRTLQPFCSIEPPRGARRPCTIRGRCTVLSMDFGEHPLQARNWFAAAGDGVVSMVFLWALETCRALDPVGGIGVTMGPWRVLPALGNVAFRAVWRGPGAWRARYGLGAAGDVLPGDSLPALEPCRAGQHPRRVVMRASPWRPVTILQMQRIRRYFRHEKKCSGMSLHKDSNMLSPTCRHTCLSISCFSHNSDNSAQLAIVIPVQIHKAQAQFQTICQPGRASALLPRQDNRTLPSIPYT
jgi:hypothetical protein